MSAHDALFFSRNRPFVPVVPERNRKREPKAPRALYGSVTMRRGRERPSRLVAARRDSGLPESAQTFPPPTWHPASRRRGYGGVEVLRFSFFEVQFEVFSGVGP